MRTRMHAAGMRPDDRNAAKQAGDAKPESVVEAACREHFGTRFKTFSLFQQSNFIAGVELPGGEGSRDEVLNQLNWPVRAVRGMTACAYEQLVACGIGECDAIA